MSQINHLNLNSHWQSFFGEILYDSAPTSRGLFELRGRNTDLPICHITPGRKCKFFILFILAVFLQITVLITVVIEGVWLFEFLMLVALAISHLLMPAALTILD
jgi:hypothetical protein